MGTNAFFKTASGLVSVATRMRTLHPDMTILQLQAFLLVARDPGITQRALMGALDTQDSTASRTVGILSEFGNRTTPGLKLVRMEVNIDDRRERNCYLTRKGEALLVDIMKDLK